MPWFGFVRKELETLDRSDRVMKEFSLFNTALLMLIAAILTFQQSTTHLTVFTSAVIDSALLMGFATFVSPSHLRPVNYILLCFSICVGKVVSIIVLTLVIGVIITPIGLIMRWFGRDSMDRGFCCECQSYWKPRSNKLHAKERYIHLF